MNYIRKYPGWKIHQVIDNEIIFTKNNHIIVCDYSFKIKHKRKIRVGLPIRFVFVFSIISKILRKEIFELKKFNDGFAGFFAGYFFYISDKSFFKYSNFKGNRGLRLLYDVINNRLLFGEYFSNGSKNDLKRDEVKIFQFDSSLKMTSPYKFNKNVVRHIHNILLNRFNNKYIVLTGDNDCESKIIEFDFNFKHSNVLGSNNQIFRAVDLVCQKNEYIVASDTEKVQNVIYNLDQNKKTSHFTTVEGSVFFIKKYQKFYLATTALEPGLINQQEFVFLYASLDGKRWITLKKFKKSIYPLKLSKVFRYPSIELIDITDSNFGYIPLYMRNIRKHNDGTYFYSESDILNRILNN